MFQDKTWGVTNVVSSLPVRQTVYMLVVLCGVLGPPLTFPFDAIHNCWGI